MVAAGIFALNDRRRIVGNTTERLDRKQCVNVSLLLAGVVALALIVNHDNVATRGKILHTIIAAGHLCQGRNGQKQGEEEKR